MWVGACLVKVCIMSGLDDRPCTYSCQSIPIDASALIDQLWKGQNCGVVFRMWDCYPCTHADHIITRAWRTCHMRVQNITDSDRS